MLVEKVSCGESICSFVSKLDKKVNWILCERLCKQGEGQIQGVVEKLMINGRLCLGGLIEPNKALLSDKFSVALQICHRALRSIDLKTTRGFCIHE